MLTDLPSDVGSSPRSRPQRTTSGAEGLRPGIARFNQARKAGSLARFQRTPKAPSVGLDAGRFNPVNGCVVSAIKHAHERLNHVGSLPFQIGSAPLNRKMNHKPASVF